MPQTRFARLFSLVAILLSVAIFLRGYRQYERRRLTAELGQAVFQGNWPRARGLLAAGADINLRDRYGESALYGALARGRTDSALFLLENGFDVHKGRAPAGSNYTLLMAACDDSPIVTMEFSVRTRKPTPEQVEKQVKIVQLLLERGESVNATYATGLTALHYAAMSGRAAIVKRLLDRGASVDAPDIAGQTPLILAAHGGHSDAVRVLLAHGARTDTRGKGYGTALEAATKSKSPEVVALLHAAGEKR